MTRPARFALAAALLAATLAPAAAHAFVNCCFVKSVGAEVHICQVIGTDAHDFPDWAATMGFDTDLEWGERSPRVILGGTWLMTSGRPTEGHWSLRDLRLAPCPTSIVVFDCPGMDKPPSPWPAASRPHPNGAARVLGYFAVARNSESAKAAFRADPLVQRWGRELGCDRDAEADTDRCEWTIGETSLRVLVPGSKPGLAQRWLGAGDGGWIGMVVAVRDLGVAERALLDRGTAFQALETEFGRGLLVDPGVDKGPVIEFVRDPSSF